MRQFISSLTNPFKAVWEYFKSMNSENNGKASIKRNIAWGVATLLVFVEVYPLIVLKHNTNEMQLYTELCKFYVVADISLIVLTLGIARIADLKETLAQLRGGNVTITNDKPKEE